MTTLLIENPAGLDHEMPPGHPEQIARLEAVFDALSQPSFSGLKREVAPQAQIADLLLAHPQAHVDAIHAAMPETGLVAFDPDTTASPGTWDASIRGAGGMITAVDAVLDGRATNAFVATRPPGHHAEKTRAMGFCFFGNIAIGALHALERRGLARVAIVDFDVHHGNGTQDITLGRAPHAFRLQPADAAFPRLRCRLRAGRRPTTSSTCPCLPAPTAPRCVACTRPVCSPRCGRSTPTSS
jgi:acetoin utilization deacetylase AcuC-like enzyme